MLLVSYKGIIYYHRSIFGSIVLICYFNLDTKTLFILVVIIKCLYKAISLLHKQHNLNGEPKALAVPLAIFAFGSPFSPSVLYSRLYFATSIMLATKYFLYSHDSIILVQPHV